MGWRYLMFTIGAVTLSVFILRTFVFRFRETPKFLIYKGRDAKAIEVLQHMAEVNKTECRLTLEALQSLHSEQNSLHSADESVPALGGRRRRDKLLPGTKLDVKSHAARYKLLFNGWRMTRLTLLVWITYILDYAAFTVAGKTQAPRLARQGKSMQQKLTPLPPQASTSLSSSPSRMAPFP